MARLGRRAASQAGGPAKALPPSGAVPHSGREQFAAAGDGGARRQTLPLPAAIGFTRLNSWGLQPGLLDRHGAARLAMTGAVSALLPLDRHGATRLAATRRFRGRGAPGHRIYPLEFLGPRPGLLDRHGAARLAMTGGLSSSRGAAKRRRGDPGAVGRRRPSDLPA
jgi:hypothetical protein